MKQVSAAFSHVPAALIALAAVVLSISATAATAGYTLVGIGMHQETGRDIYLGGLHLPESNTPPTELAGISG